MLCLPLAESHEIITKALLAHTCSTPLPCHATGWTGGRRGTAAYLTIHDLAGEGGQSEKKQAEFLKLGVMSVCFAWKKRRIRLGLIHSPLSTTAASFGLVLFFASVFLQVDSTAGRRLELCARHYPLSLRHSLDPGLLTLSITLVIPRLPALVAPSVRLILSAC